MVSGKLRKGLTEWVKIKKGDKYLIDAGHEIAVNDRSETLGGMMQQIREGQSKWEVNEGCKQMWMGKGVRERQTRWNNQPMEEAVCKMAGCGGVEDWWHVVSDCCGGDMVKEIPL